MLEELISLFCLQSLDSTKLTLQYKTFKAGKLAMTNFIVLNSINKELLAANPEIKQRAQRIGIEYNSQRG